MDLTSILDQLRMERDAIDAAISNLVRLQQGGNRGPVRPPNLVAKGNSNGANHGYRLPVPPADEE
jgi:hypothetical protein